MNTLINSQSLETITNTLNKALIQRGFPTVTLSDNNNDRYPALDAISEKFNTTPVIMKSIQIDNFGGSYERSTKPTFQKAEDGTITEIMHDVISVWIPIHVSYEHSSGGTNGTELFGYHCEIFEDDGRQFVENENISC